METNIFDAKEFQYIVGFVKELDPEVEVEFSPPFPNREIYEARLSKEGHPSDKFIVDRAWLEDLRDNPENSPTHREIKKKVRKGANETLKRMNVLKPPIGFRDTSESTP